MNQIISRDFINPSINYYDGVTRELRTIDDFRDSINFWKIIFHEGYGLRAGNIVSFFDSSIRFSYTAAFFAAAELGLQLLTPPEKPTDSSGRTTKLDQMLGAGKIDLCIIDSNVSNSPEISAMARYYSKQVVEQDIFNTYKIKDPELYKTISELVAVTTESPILITTSSGTTGEPKLVAYTHQQLYSISKRNAEVFGFCGQTVCHSRNMHHAFVLMVNFLPTLHAANNHYTFAVNEFDPNDFKNYVDFLLDNKITKMSLSNKTNLDGILDYMINNGVQFEHTIDLIVGGFYITEDYINKIKQTNVHQLISNFGSNETLGPILLKYVTQDTDVATFKMNYMGQPVDDFYQLELIDNHLNVQCPVLFPGTITMGDEMSGDNESGYLHLGRNNFYRINEVDFSLKAVAEIVQRYTTSEFDICIDLPYQRLYLALWNSYVGKDVINQALATMFGPNLMFSFVEQLDKSKFNQGFKLDQDAIRSYFRSKTQ